MNRTCADDILENKFNNIHSLLIFLSKIFNKLRKHIFFLQRPALLRIGEILLKNMYLEEEHVTGRILEN